MEVLKRIFAYFFFVVILVVTFVVTAVANSSWYDIDLTEGTDAVKAVAAVVLVGLAVMWGIRKVIKTTNKS